MRTKIIVILITIIFHLGFVNVNSEIFIKAKVNNQILTNYELNNEKNYLLALNPSLRNLSKENIDRYAIDSLINEYVKRIEIEKKFEILQNKEMIEKIISDLYLGIGLASIEEFKEHLKKFNINLELVKKKI